MVILRVSPGLANAMLEYAVGYALAADLKQELVLDISEYDNSIWPYLLDQFKIVSKNKIIYPVSNIHAEHSDIGGIDKSLKEKSYLLVEDSKLQGANIYYYDDLSNGNWKSLINQKDLYLCGYFFNPKYYKKYWKEISIQFDTSRVYEEVKSFNNLICNKNSIGVHIRRGDMIFAEWAIELQDNYYRAAISWYRNKIKNCVFLIFTDDKEYAKEILGNQEDIYYIDMLGFDEADLLEFICLSKCTHRILSNSSTFSRLADELNGIKGRCVIQKGMLNKIGVCTQLRYVLSRNTRWYINKLTMARTINLTDKEIKKYSDIFKNKIMASVNRQESEKILKEEIGVQNAKEILERLGRLSNDSYEITNENRKQLIRKKMQALYYAKEFDRVVELAYVIYSPYCKDSTFRNEYITALEAKGHYDEAEIEKASYFSKDIEFKGQTEYNRKYKKLEKQICFIVMGWKQSYVYSKNTEEMQLADILSHLGQRVIFLFDDEGKTSNIYLDSVEGKKYKNVAGIESNYISYTRKIVKQIGIDEIINKHFGKTVKKEIVGIIRCKEDSEILSGVTKIFYDFTNSSDYSYAERSIVSDAEKEFLYNNSIGIITSDKKIYVKYKEKCMFSNNSDNLQIISEKIGWDKCHRMNPKRIKQALNIINYI